MNRKAKVLVLILSAAMLVCAMPTIGFAAVDAQNPIEITSVSIAPATDTSLLDVIVNYDVLDGVGDQVTILATSEALVSQDGANIVYIDQVAKPAVGSRNFSFKVAKADFPTTGGVLYVKMGGTSITKTGGKNENLPADQQSATIPETNITIVFGNPFGIADAGVITINNVGASGNIVDPALKNITVGGTTLYYNATRNKFVGIVRSATNMTAATASSNAVIGNVASEELIYGRINDDEEISPIDAGNIISIYLESISATDKQLLASDVNDDREVSPIDAGNVISRYLESISKFAIEDK